jgi:rare lipoprotein A
MRSALPLLVLTPLLAACAGSPGSINKLNTAGAGHYKVGKPYQIRGKWYRPADDRDYDETGIASWYGPKFDGKPTANGEIFDQDALTAAHKTLPLPSFVEVTNLENGRKLTVRVNDRGPFVDDRIIDLSRRSAQLLGMQAAGIARVRVRRVYPGADERAQIARAPAPKPKPSPPVFVQIAALTNAERASGLAAEMRRYGSSLVSRDEIGFYLVRLGPFTDGDRAASALEAVRAAGYTDARIIAMPPSA